MPVCLCISVCLFVAEVGMRWRVWMLGVGVDDFVVYRVVCTETTDLSSISP